MAGQNRLADLEALAKGDSPSDPATKGNRRGLADLVVQAGPAPVATGDQPPAEPYHPLDSAINFGKGVIKSMNPLPPDFQTGDLTEGPKQMLTHPWNSFGLLGDAIWQGIKGEGQQFGQSVSEFGNAPDNLSRVEATGKMAQHAIGMVPLVGPAVSGAMDEARAGNYAGAFGQLTGLVFPELAARGAAAVKLKPPAMRGAAALEASNKVLKDTRSFSGAVDKQGFSSGLTKEKLGVKAGADLGNAPLPLSPGADLMATMLEKNPDEAYNILKDASVSAEKFREIKAAVSPATFKAMTGQLLRDFMMDTWQEGSTMQEGRYSTGMLDSLNRTSTGQALKRAMDPAHYEALKDIARATKTMGDPSKFMEHVHNILSVSHVAQKLGVPGAGSAAWTASIMGRILTRPEGLQITRRLAQAYGHSNAKQVIFWSNRLTSYAGREFDKKEPQKPMPPPIPGGG